MPVDVRFTEFAIDCLSNFEVESRERITSKVEDIVDFPGHYLDSLTNVPGYKLRVGDFRIIVDWDRTNDVLYVVAVLECKYDYRELSNLEDRWGAWRE